MTLFEKHLNKKEKLFVKLSTHPVSYACLNYMHQIDAISSYNNCEHRTIAWTCRMLPSYNGNYVKKSCRKFYKYVDYTFHQLSVTPWIYKQQMFFPHFLKWLTIFLHTCVAFDVLFQVSWTSCSYKGHCMCVVDRN